MSRRLISAGLAALLAVMPNIALAEARPTVVVPPMPGDQNNENARQALAKALNETHAVTVVETELVDRHLQKDAKAAGSQEDLKRARDLLKRGISLFQKLEIDAAIERLETARQIYRKNLQEDKSFEGLRASQFYLAMSLLAKKERSRAKEELTEVVLLDSQRYTRKLSSKLYSAEIRNLYDDIRNEMRAKPHGDIEIATTPSGAVVYLDGKSAGLSPLVIKDIPAGNHFFKIEKEGRQAYFDQRTVIEGDNRFDVELVPTLKLDPAVYFSPVSRSEDITPKRARVLDELGLKLGADIIVLLSPKPGSVAAQLYDQRSQEVSPQITKTSPQALAEDLVQFLDPEGYVVSAQDLQPEVVERKRAPDMTSGSTLSEQMRKPLVTENPPGEKRLWYENPWVWGAIGVGLLIAGGSAFLFTDLGKTNPSKNTLVITFP